MKKLIYIIGALLLLCSMGFSQFTVPAVTKYTVDTLSGTNLIFSNGSTGTLVVGTLTGARDSVLTAVGGHFERGLLVSGVTQTLSLISTTTSGQLGWLKRNPSAPSSGTVSAATTTDTITNTYFKVTTKLIPPTSGIVGFWQRNASAPQSGTLTPGTNTDTAKVATLIPTGTSSQIGWLSRNVTAPASGTLTAATATDTLSFSYVIVTTKLTPPTSGTIGFLTRNAAAPASGKLTTTTNTDTLNVLKLSVGTSSVYASMGGASQMDSARVATIDKAQTLAGVQTFSALNTFTGTNTGTAVLATTDSTTVAVTGLTEATGIAVVSYVGLHGLADTAASYKVWANGTLSLYGKHGKTVSYFITRK